jgi:hypothetical protein
MLESYGWDNDKLLNDYIEQAKKDFSKEYFCRIQELLDDETNLDLQKRGIEYLLSIPYVHVNDYVKMSNGIMQEIWLKSIFMATLMGCCNEYEHAREADYGLVFYMEIAKEYIKEIFNSITDYLHYNLEIEHFEDDMLQPTLTSFFMPDSISRISSEAFSDFGI